MTAHVFQSYAPPTKSTETYYVAFFVEGRWVAKPCMQTLKSREGAAIVLLIITRCAVDRTSSR